MGATRICRAIAPLSAADGAPRGCGFVTAVNHPPSPRDQAHPAAVSFVDTLPAEMQSQHALDAAVYTVEVLNDHGRTAGASNPASVLLAPTLPPPKDLRAEVARDYVVVSWTAAPETAAGGNSTNYGYRVFREQPEAKRPATTVDLWRTEGVRYFDKSFEWNTRYVYRVAAITSVARDGQPPAVVEGERSAPVEVVTKDVFPPPAPSGLQAIFTEAGAERYVDLTWLPSANADIAGYNVYRWEEGGSPSKITTASLKTPTWRDSSVAPGRRYFYAVTAIDIRGNESPRSQPASELVPK
jgi:hypothetical protein